jgi:WhiB family transcriptional regulator, redox-sensing transcriptional regulator
MDTARQQRPTWERHAACRDETVPQGLFFSEDLTEIAAAKRVCATCPVLFPCLEAALSRAEPCGVWGGQLFAQGRIVLRKRRRGRPAKVARPEDQVPMVPIPPELAARAALRTA